MKRLRQSIIIFLLVFFLPGTNLHAQQQGALEDQVIKPENAQIADDDVGVTEHLNDTIPGDITLINQYGERSNSAGL